MGLLLMLDIEQHCLSKAAYLQGVKLQKGTVKIGNLNFILIGLIALIVLGLLLNEPQSSKVVVPPVQEQESPPVRPIETESRTVDTPEPPVPPSVSDAQTHAQPTLKKTGKSVKKEQANMTVGDVSSPQAGMEVQSTSRESLNETPKEAPKDMIVFNIWSVSELRLRAAYIKLMNDSSVAAAQTDTRKKEYLNFVAGKTRKCGELDPKFASNINSVEKLTFHNGDIVILECHTAENIIELDRLNKQNGSES